MPCSHATFAWTDPVSLVATTLFPFLLSLSLSFLIGLHNISSMLFAIVPVGAGGHLMANSTFAGYNLVRVPLEPVSGTRWVPCSNCALA